MSKKHVLCKYVALRTNNRLKRVLLGALSGQELKPILWRCTADSRTVSPRTTGWNFGHARSCSPALAKDLSLSLYIYIYIYNTCVYIYIYI